MRYQSLLSLKETELAIKFVKDNFEAKLAHNLNLMRVSAPLFVLKSSGLNDNLNGVERPVAFDAKDIKEEIEVVHSLAKWKREALSRYNIGEHQGIYADMNAIRRDETLDNIHSLYVDQWDYEIVIKKEERNLDFLFKVVKIIYKTMREIEDLVNSRYPVFKNKLPEEIVFVNASSLEEEYPNISRKEREKEAAKKYKAIFLYPIGWNLKDGKPHDGRAPDYDDWNLNGDIIVYNPILDNAFELSSMGIRVDEESIVKQIKERKREEMLKTPFTQKVIHKELPYTLGGGIGQSRLCMFYLEKAHIGEVQASIWSEEEKKNAHDQGIELL